MVGEGGEGSATRRGKGREEKRGRRTLGRGLLVLLLLGEEGVVGGVGIVEKLSQAEHFLLRVFVLFAVDVLLLPLITLLLCVGGLLLQRRDLFLKVRDLLLEVRKRRGSLRRGRRRRRRGRRGGGRR